MVLLKTTQNVPPLSTRDLHAALWQVTLLSPVLAAPSEDILVSTGTLRNYPPALLPTHQGIRFRSLLEASAYAFMISWRILLFASQYEGPACDCQVLHHLAVVSGLHSYFIHS